MTNKIQIQGKNVVDNILNKYLSSELFMGYTGKITIELDCNQGGIAGIQVDTSTKVKVEKK